MKLRLQPGWSEGCLGDVITNVTAGTSANCEDREYRDGDRRVLKLSAVSGGRFIPTEAKVVARNEHSRLRTPVRSGTVLFTRKNTPELVGDSAYVSENVGELYLPDLIWELNTARGIEPRWLNHWLQAHSFRRQIPSISAGSSQSMVGISQGNFLASSVIIPPRREQKRIIAVLDAWDQAIKHANHLAALMKQRYRGIRHSLVGFSFDDSISNTWLPYKLGQLFSERDERSAELPLLSITGENGVVPRDELDRRQTASEDKSKYKVIRPDDIGFNTMRMWQGVFGKSEYTGIVSPAYTVVTAIDDLCDPTFISHLFDHPRAISLFHRYSQGLVDDTLMLKFPQFAEISMRLPGIERQREIGKILEGERATLRPQSRYLASLRTQKRGLMQKLLTGEWRLGENFE